MKDGDLPNKTSVDNFAQTFVTLFQGPASCAKAFFGWDNGKETRTYIRPVGVKRGTLHWP